MTPVNLGDLPSAQPIPTGLGQLKRGASANEYGCTGPNPFSDGAGGSMQIAITTGSRPGWWIVRAETIFRLLDSAWYYFAWSVRLSPADALGVSQEMGHGRLHVIPSWQHYAIDTVYKLNANTTYTAAMWFEYHQAGTVMIYLGPEYTYIGGEFIAEGSL
jgi:hypothetical protein